MFLMEEKANDDRNDETCQSDIQIIILFVFKTYKLKITHSINETQKRKMHKIAYESYNALPIIDLSHKIVYLDRRNK